MVFLPKNFGPTVGVVGWIVVVVDVVVVVGGEDVDGILVVVLPLGLKPPDPLPKPQKLSWKFPNCECVVARFLVPALPLPQFQLPKPPLPSGELVVAWRLPELGLKFPLPDHPVKPLGTGGAIVVASPALGLKPDP